MGSSARRATGLGNVTSLFFHAVFPPKKAGTKCKLRARTHGNTCGAHPPPRCMLNVQPSNRHAWRDTVEQRTSETIVSIKPIDTVMLVSGDQQCARYLAASGVPWRRGAQSRNMRQDMFPQNGIFNYSLVRKREKVRELPCLGARGGDTGRGGERGGGEGVGTDCRTNPHSSRLRELL